jgi:peptidoglycan DL-endopeptidase CwlO
MGGNAFVLKTAKPRRRTALIVALFAAAAVLLTSPGLPGAAAPGDSTGTDDEGGTAALRKVLEAAGRAYSDAKIKLDNSKKRQVALGVQLQQLEENHGKLLVEVGHVAAMAYRNGRLTTASMLLDSGSPEAFWQRATVADSLARADGKQLKRLIESSKQLRVAKAAIDNEVREQTKQLAIMARRKEDAERALRAAGGGGPAGGFVAANSPLARPAPRNPDGSWPRESCSVNDPTTSGCITPRTLHAMNEARAAGYTHYRSCYRSGGGGEHPKGRACDFAAAKGGFENRNASGADRTYGNSLAAFFVKNADRLGVLYVIWYRQIWQPSTGWRSYSGGGSPAASHTNHVHLSMQ